MENSTYYWNSFLNSGKISDYLQYRQALLQESATESTVLEENDAPEHRGTCDNGKEYG